MDSKISKESLKKSCSTKIRTTMIGAVNEFEIIFGYLWGHGLNQEMTENQKKFFKLWTRLRSRILNNGNNQIRDLDNLFDKYEINLYKYQYQMPVKRRKDVNQSS